VDKWREIPFNSALPPTAYLREKGRESPDWKEFRKEELFILKVPLEERRREEREKMKKE
jgi:hypothetical protein